MRKEFENKMLQLKESHILEIKKISVNNEKQIHELSDLYNQREIKLNE